MGSRHRILLRCCLYDSRRLLCCHRRRLVADAPFNVGVGWPGNIYNFLISSSHPHMVCYLVSMLPSISSLHQNSAVGGFVFRKT